MGVFGLKTPIDFVFGFAHNKCTVFFGGTISKGEPAENRDKRDMVP